LRAGVAPSILGVPASELVDLQVEADRVWGSEAATLAGRLAEARSLDGAARVLEQELGRRATEARAADPLVTAAIGRLQPWRRDDVSAWTSELFISQRQLRRRFVAALGFGPKTLQRILRFQGFLALSGLGRGHSGRLASLAHAAGYADQAHLTRDCSELTGLTPRTFLDETWRSCGASHDHEASHAGLRRALLGVDGV
jgi:AraC-like DNA-binding protein